MKRSILSSLLVLLMIAMPVIANASSISSGPINVPASISINESLTLTITGGPLVIPPTQNGVSNVLNLSATYNLISANHAGGLQYVTYFSATNALTGNFTVLSSNLSTQVNGGSFIPCSGVSVQGSVANATCSTWTHLTQTQLNTTPSGTDTNTVAVQYTGSTLTNAGSASGTFNVLAYAL